MRLTIGVILAGGRSTRMGQDKANLIVDGQRLLDRARDLLFQCCDEVIVVGGPESDYRDDVVDGVSDGGPLGGVLAALRSGRGHRYLCLPVDQPRLTPDALQPLLDACPFTGNVGVSYDGEPLPVCLTSDRVDALAIAWRDGARRLEVAATTRLELDAATRAALFNMNTPADLATVTGRPPPA